MWLYNWDHNRLDIMNTHIGIAYHRKWKLSETEIALYESERTNGPPVPARSCTVYSGLSGTCTYVVGKR